MNKDGLDCNTQYIKKFIDLQCRMYLILNLFINYMSYETKAVLLLKMSFTYAIEHKDVELMPN